MFNRSKIDSLEYQMRGLQGDWRLLFDRYHELAGEIRMILDHLGLEVEAQKPRRLVEKKAQK